MAKTFLLVAVLSLTGSTASAKERLGKKTGAALHRLAKGADRLEVIRVDAPLCAEPMIRVTDSKEIEALLRLLDGLRNSNVVHGCVGHPVTKLYRGKKLLAEFSVDHGTIIRGHGELRVFQDSPMPEEMAMQVAAWYRDHGLAAYQIEAEQEFSTDEGVGRAIAMLPTMTRKFLSERYADPREAFSDLATVFTKEVPNTKQQASLLLRSLAQLSTPAQHGRLAIALGQLKRAVPREAILSVLNQAPTGSEELLGALLLEDVELDERMLARGSGPFPELRDRIAQRIAGEPVNEWALAFIERMGRARDLSPQTQDYLFQAMSSWAQQVCFTDTNYEWGLNHWIRSAVDRQLPSWFIRLLRETTWSCPMDKTIARVILKISQGELPNPQDLLCVDYATLDGVREFAQRRGTAEDIDFALSYLLKDGRGFEKIMKWLTPVSGLSEQEAGPGRLKDWWNTARATYRPPAPTAPSGP